MHVEEFLHRIEELLKILCDSTASNKIALLSVFVLICALGATVVFNVLTHRQYIRSLAPLLSFKLLESAGMLVLQVENTGKSYAGLVELKFGEMRDNGDDSQIFENHIFKKAFTLYPNEKIQGAIAFSGENIGTKIFPQINIAVRLKKGNDKKEQTYERTVTYTNQSENLGSTMLYGELKTLVQEVESISCAVNRVTNYFEGRHLSKADTDDYMPFSSLYKDMRDAMNNVVRKDDESDE